MRHRLTPPEGQHFNGHGVFSAGGTALLTRERRSDTRAGFIGAWDVGAGDTRCNEYPSGGIGPHGLRAMPDGGTRVTAHGGIATDPGDRRKLNLGTMRLNLACLSLSGLAREQVEPGADLHQNSIRHLALRSDGLVGSAMQWKGTPGVAAPPPGLHRRGAAPVLAHAPLADELVMQAYAGSVAFSGAGHEIALTSPRAVPVSRFTEDGVFHADLSRAEVCGLAPMGQEYLASDRLGGLRVDAAGATPLARAQCAWDNHTVAL